MQHRSINWSKTRRAVQIIFLFLWLVLWLFTARLVWGSGILRLPTELDPLLALTQAIASRAFTAGMLFSLIVLGLTLVLGRAWCGWICPIGTLLDFFPFRRKQVQKPAVSERWRMGKYLILLSILLAAVFGNLTLLFLDPVTIWVRTMTGGVGPALNAAFTAAENALSSISWLNSPLTWIDQALRPAVFPAETVGIRLVWLTVFLFVILLLLNLAAERFWCRYLCPLGGLLGFVSKFALIKRQVEMDCKSCGQCSKICPTGTIDPQRGYASDPAECTLCMDCLGSCPFNANKMKMGVPEPQKMPYDPDRRQLLMTGAVTLAGLAVIDTKITKQNQSGFLLRPPGSNNDDLLKKCLRCGLCMRSCPTGALQSSYTESGLAGIFTPVVVPRLGYCLYTCNNCGSLCPVGAIPPLPLEQKQKWVIGHAFIDQNRCIPWADGVNCIVCQEMCPLPEKAITLEEKIITQGSQTFTLKLPHVLRDVCIGCGICEYKCPRSGEAAIRVYQRE